jgi:hypothetical protein
MRFGDDERHLRRQNGHDAPREVLVRVHAATNAAITNSADASAHLMLRIAISAHAGHLLSRNVLQHAT